MKKLGIIISIMFFATPQMWCAPGGGDAVAPEDESGRLLNASKKETPVDVDGRDGRTTFNLVKSKKPLIPDVQTLVTHVILPTVGLAALMTTGVLGYLYGDDIYDFFAGTSESETPLGDILRTFNGTSQDGFNYFCQNVSMAGQRLEEYWPQLQLNVTELKETLINGACQGTEVSFEFVRQALLRAEEQIARGDGRSPDVLVRERLEEACQNMPCRMGDALNSVVEQIVHSRVAEIMCNGTSYVINGFSGFQEHVCQERGFLGSSPWTAGERFFSSIVAQSKACAGFVLKSIAEVAENSCGSNVLDYLKCVSSDMASFREEIVCD